MSQASDFQPAWLLHSRPYRETSALAWLLTLEEGRVNAVVRGVRTKKSRYRALLQPFTPLLVRVSGKHELKNLVGLEATSAPHWLSGEALVCGLYANELLSRLLLPSQACPALFRDYSLLLQLLNNTDQREPALRRFELSLLEHLGYPLLFNDHLGAPLAKECLYRWLPEQGFLMVQGIAEPHNRTYTGASLLAIANDDWQEKLTRKTAKALTRQLLAPLLGNKPLLSRQLFLQMKKPSLK
ncbi:DNA repair protein RecO [Marinospirillum insulare]|uniref:DNA repair protein RecO n=1 Tax=Marinospirillum insulare TaxID=217169 RepID=A0ABQ5ZWC8_9GAMM|nr:DNA repair protein RecO [Marinospirillum insulare]GLR62677.1 DNA repair protein RecO [Marinospirillum insulare]